MCHVVNAVCVRVLAADIDEEEFVVTVRYCGTEVLNRTVSGRTGCRLCYDQLHVTERLDDFLPSEFRQTVFSTELLLLLLLCKKLKTPEKKIS